VGSYTWTFDLPSPGAYEVFVWWTSWATRSERVPYTIFAATGTVSLTANQQVHAGRWNYLGEFAFGRQAIVRIDGRADGGSYCADAVRVRSVR
jgi:hypothetical protein